MILMIQLQSALNSERVARDLEHTRAEELNNLLDKVRMKIVVLFIRWCAMYKSVNTICRQAPKKKN